MKKFSKTLPAPLRGALALGGLVDGAARMAALADLQEHEEGEVLGKKLHWQVGLALGNSFGLLPLAYFLAGREEGPLHGPAGAVVEAVAKRLA